MNKPITPGLFILIMTSILLAGLGGILYFHLQLNKDKSLIDSYSLHGGPVTRHPKSVTLEVFEPEDDSLSFKPSVLVSGKTLPKLPVLISSQDSDLVVESKSDGSFSTVVDLEEGFNNLNITVFNSSGEEKLVSKQVYYSKEKL